MIIFNPYTSLSQENDTTGSLSGRITDENGEPAMGALIEVFQQDHKKGGCVADDKGAYLLKSLVPGIYDVHIVSVGYMRTVFKDIVIGSVKTQNLNHQFISNNDPADWKSELFGRNRLPMVPSISGKITDEDNVPAIGALVTAHKNGVMCNGAQTDDTGSYTISNLQPGTYELQVEMPTYHKGIIKKIKVVDGKTSTRNYKLKPLPLSVVH